MLRKGAIDASEGRKVAIPFNMCDGIAICIGKGNTQWLYTAPHGAGRIMSRAQSQKTNFNGRFSGFNDRNLFIIDLHRHT